MSLFSTTLPQETVTVVFVTAVITSLVVGVFGKRIAEFLLEATLGPLRGLLDLAYGWVAPRNPLSLSLRIYRKHLLRSHLARIENPLGPTLDVGLEKSFVPLRLVCGAHLDRKVTLPEHVSTVRRLMILGGPGTGKTTLLKHLVTTIVKKQSAKELNPLVPVFVILRNLAANRHTVEQAIEAALAEYHFPGSHPFVAASLAAGKMLVVLDGLDEVGASREFVLGEIARFCNRDSQRDSPNRVLVSSREHSYRARELRECIPEILHVEPFTGGDMRAFLACWPAFKGRSAMQLYGPIQQDAQIRDICANPLLLTLLVGIYLETEEFSLPASRAQFYRAALEELVVRRPARRNIQQRYSERAKQSILEHIALQSLVNLSLTQDVEEITYESFSEAAEAEMAGHGEVEDLIRELVEVNGIVKPTPTGKYTFIHKTVQEYLAAREVLRRRELSELVVSLGDTPELLEILLFCCGSLDNLPALGRIIESLGARGQWLDAARCLLHMTELPEGVRVAKICAHLRDQIVTTADGYQAITTLSSLANRQGMAFDAARAIFAQAVADIIESDTNELTVHSLIARSPQSVPSLIPGLLRHTSDRWHAIDPMFLREHDGVDAVIDQLMLLLSDPDPTVRFRAAALLAESITGRNAAMRQRAALLPTKQDPEIWPLEAQFPGTIALSIAEALAPASLSGNAAIDCAIVAIRMRQSGTQSEFLHLWRKVPRDAQLSRWRITVADRLLQSGVALAFGAACILMPIYYLTVAPSERWYEIAQVASLHGLMAFGLYVLLREKLRYVPGNQEDIGRHRVLSATGLALCWVSSVCAMALSVCKPLSWPPVMWPYVAIPSIALLLRAIPWPRNPFLVAI